MMSSSVLVAETPVSPEETAVPASETSSSWPVIKMRLERSLRPLCLRWGKPTEDAIDKIVRNIIGVEIDADDWLYRKAVFKCHSNIATWKNRTLADIEVSTYFL